MNGTQAPAVRSIRGLVGSAVPVSCREAAINASMSLIVRAADSNESMKRRLLMMLAPLADMLSRKLRDGLSFK